MRQVPVAARLALAGLITAVALTVALWPRGDDTSIDGARVPPSAPVPEQLRAAAGLAPCPPPAADAVGHGPLAGITLSCLADGKPVDVAAALAGKPALLNLWAYWCGPCAEELPFLQEYAERAGNAITVLTVHSDPDEARGLALLADLKVTLPGVLDASTRVRNAVGVPAVLPVSVLLRADGSVAKAIVRPFDGVEDIADTVATELGVAA
ncbi:TlpA disulfide reductase family protein [Nocardia sp. NPDC051463]|uniref:TlpA family protein disulfide reductase n=1 Tax=Nocardia sp. NPDC051463 TaxID=3154845 RepID=UPI00344D22A3